MKNLFRNLLLLTVVGSLVGLYSCDGDPETLAGVPTLTLQSTDFDASNTFTGQPGSSASFSIVVDAPGVFNTFSADILLDGVSIGDTIHSRESGTTPTSYTFGPVSIDLEQAFVGKTLTIEATATDDLNQTSEVLTLTILTTSPDAKVQTAVLLYAPTLDKTSQSFYSIATNTTYSLGDVTGTTAPVSADIDLGYYYGGNNLATLASPSVYPATVYDISAWGTKNETLMVAVTLTAEQYLAITTVADVDAVVSSVNFGVDGVAIEKSLAAGNTFAFKTSAGLTGLVNVKAITGTFNQGDNIELEFILNQAAL